MKNTLIRTLIISCGMATQIAFPATAHTQTPQQDCEAVIAATSEDIELAAKYTNTTRLEKAHELATGLGVPIAVIDTGISPHPRLPEIIPGGDLVAEGDGLFDCDVHGTVVASVLGLRPGSDQLRGVAFDSPLISIRQSSSQTQREGNLASLVTAIDRAVERGAGVITMSIASCLTPQQAALVDFTPLQDAITRAHNSGAVLVAASGNVGSNCTKDSVVYPASLEHVIPVTALDAASAYEWADYAIDVEQPLAAPGFVPVAASPRDPGLVRSTGRAEFIGTSFAAPYVAGVLALMKQYYPTDSPDQLTQRLYQSVDPQTGVVDPLRALGLHTTAAAAPREVQLQAAQATDHSYKIRAVWLTLLLALGIAAVVLWRTVRTIYRG